MMTRWLDYLSVRALEHAMVACLVMGCVLWFVSITGALACVSFGLVAMLLARLKDESKR